VVHLADHMLIYMLVFHHLSARPDADFYVSFPAVDF